MVERNDGNQRPPTAIGTGRPRLLVVAAATLAVGAIGGGVWIANHHDPADIDARRGAPSSVVDDPPAGRTPGPASSFGDGFTVADGDASCVVGLRRGEDDSAASGMGPILPGPSEPALLGPEWSAEAGARPGVWHVVTEEQQVEVHVPGVIVTDLMGERTEPVSLEGRAADATVWFAADWVQVRSFGGRHAPEPCSSDQSFTVTVGGPDERANRDLAVRIASSLVIDRSPVVSSGTGPQPDEREPTFSGEPVDPASLPGYWILEAVTVDGVPVAVVDAANGGTDGRPGPPVLLLSDPTRPAAPDPVLRACNAVGLSLEVDGSEGRLWLPSRALTTQMRCEGPQAEQEGRIKKVLSLGDPFVLRSDDRGRTLTIRDEATTLVFRQV